MNRVTERLREFVDDRCGDIQLALWIRLHLASDGRVIHPFALHFLLEHHDAVHEAFRTRGTPGHIDIDRDNRVYALHHRIVIEDVAARGARTHGYCPLRLRHLLPDSSNDRSELEWHAAGADQHVCLTRRKTHALHAEPCEVETTCGGRHELDGAARGAERHWPE